jgi:hypothetical protein
MPRVGFELTIPVFEREKTFHAFDRAATTIGETTLNKNHNYFCEMFYFIIYYFS